MMPGANTPIFEFQLLRLVFPGAWIAVILAAAIIVVGAIALLVVTQLVTGQPNPRYLLGFLRERREITHRRRLRNG